MADPAEKVQENVDLDGSVQQEVNKAAEQPEVESNMANDTELLFKDLLLEDMLENQSVSLEVMSILRCTRKTEVLNSLIINITAKANDTTDILQTFR